MSCVVCSERQRAAEAASAGAKALKDRAAHGVELDRYASENAELREELRVLTEDLLAYREAVAELKGDLEDAAEDRAACEGQLRDAGMRMSAVHSELAEVREQLAATQRCVL